MSIHDYRSPARLGSLELKNRLIRSGCYEGYCRNGRVTEELIEHHRQVARGGIAMTTLAYGCVLPEGRTFADQIVISRDTLPGLKSLAETVHHEGAAISVQLTHGGYFADPKVIGGKPAGASKVFNNYRLTSPIPMDSNDISRVVDSFCNAASLVREAGFDAVEIHAGHGYLLSQFLSPYTNRREDDWGGSAENRCRLPSAVVRELRSVLGPYFPILVKMNVTDGIKGGLEIDDALTAASAFEHAGVSALVPSCGFTSRTPFMMLRGNVPVKEMARGRPAVSERIFTRLFGKFLVRTYPYEPLFLRSYSEMVLNRVKIPVVYVGGVISDNGIVSLIERGFSFVQIGRATIRNPNFPAGLIAGDISESDCDFCNRCVAAMDDGGVRCVTAEEESVKSL